MVTVKHFEVGETVRLPSGKTAQVVKLLRNSNDDPFFRVRLKYVGSHSRDCVTLQPGLLERVTNG